MIIEICYEIISDTSVYCNIVIDRVEYWLFILYDMCRHLIAIVYVTLLDYCTQLLSLLHVIFFNYFANIIVIVLGLSAVEANGAPAQGMWRVVDRPLFVRLLRF